MFYARLKTVKKNSMNISIEFFLKLLNIFIHCSLKKKCSKKSDAVENVDNLKSVFFVLVLVVFLYHGQNMHF